MTEVLTVVNLKKQLGEKEILKSINFTVYAGQSVLLSGSNGAGKSTTLRCIVGELTKDYGTILIDGKDIEQYPLIAKKNIGYASDDPLIYPYLTGEEHLQLWRALYDSSENSINYGLTLINILGLQDASKSLVKNYSRGMQQKLSFIGSIFHKPLLILMDEPFTATDKESREKAIEILQDHKEQGAAIVFTTHQEDLKDQLSDRVLQLKDGVVSDEE
jgi:ABC-2 type transport system ATP-binding protein